MSVIKKTVIKNTVISKTVINKTVIYQRHTQIVARSEQMSIHLQTTKTATKLMDSSIQLAVQMHSMIFVL